MTLGTITNSIKCLMAMAHVNSDAEATKLIDLLSEIRIAKKYLTIVASKLNMTSLQKKTINFNVILRHIKPGNRHSQIYTNIIFVSVADETTVGQWQEYTV